MFQMCVRLHLYLRTITWFFLSFSNPFFVFPSDCIIHYLYLTVSSLFLTEYCKAHYSKLSAWLWPSVLKPLPASMFTTVRFLTGEHLDCQTTMISRTFFTTTGASPVNRLGPSSTLARDTATELSLEHQHRISYSGIGGRWIVDNHQP
jgi:hypothetical protein